jgi:hypothetical protein
MLKVIDLHNLPDEDVRLVEELVEFLEEKAKRKHTCREEKTIEPKEEKINFATWPSDVIGKLTREEIYDYL